MPIFVVVQSKEDYDREQREKARLFLKVFWWILSSFLFAEFFKPYVSGETYAYILTAFILMFATADLTGNRQLRSYIRATFGFLYSVLGIAFVFVGLVMAREELVVSLGIGALFLYLGYGNLKRYTSLLDNFSRR